MRRTTRAGLAIGALAGAWMEAPETAFAQAPPPPLALSEPVIEPPQQSTTVVYDQAFFAPYNVTTAEDMLQRLPGLDAILAAAQSQGQQRGFGQAGTQILLNGRRMAGKSNDINAALRRIRYSSVERIELIRGTTTDIDVQSQGQVVNIVLAKGASVGGSGNWELNGRFNENDWIGPDGLISYSGSWRRLSYVVGVERNLWSPPSLGQLQWTDMTRDERYFYPSGPLQEFRPQQWRRDHDKFMYTANLTYALSDGGQARLNGFYQTLAIREQNTARFVRYDLSGVPGLRGTDIQVRDIDRRKQFEIGGDYERKIGPGNYKLLFIVGRNDAPTYDLRDRILGDETRQLSRSRVQQNTGEDIVRTSYAWPIFKNQQIEFGGEIARNRLNQHTRAFFDVNNDGTAEEIAIPTAEAEVEELRAEGYTNHNWTITRKLTLETTLAVEASRISTNYPQIPQRSYLFFKPRFDLRYALTQSDQMSMQLERVVSQLDFANFVPVYDVLNDRLLSGNPALDPEKEWKLDLRYEHRFAQDGGVVEVRGFYSRLADHIDRVALVDDRGRYLPALGNIGTATVWGVEVKGSARLGFVGLRDATVNFNLRRQFSRTTDPFDHERRRVRGRFPYELDLGYRHDVTRWGVSYGATYKRNGGTTVFSDLFSRDVFAIGDRVGVFAEKQISPKVTLRLEGQQIMSAREFRSRAVFSSSQVEGVVLRRESFLEDRDRRFSVKLRGAF